MSGSKKTWIWIVAVGIVATALTIIIGHRRPVVLKGAVLREDPDPNKQVPLADVQITASNSWGSASTKSDAAGFFRFTLPKGLRHKQSVMLRLQRQGYQPLDLNDFISDKIYVIRMVALRPEVSEEPHRPAIGISNAKIRYSVATTTEADIGSAVKTFQVINTGNIPCNKQPPCSPDGRWKAVIRSSSLSAGEGNEFRNARISCIAGPCPFTKIELEDLTQDGRQFNVTVRDWSDTTTFLLEAEVVHPMVSNLVRVSYPVIFGRALNFSLPASAEGPSIEAEIDGSAIVFPLGPDLYLRWAECHVGVDKDQSKTYRCELKPGYQIREPSPAHAE